jgi:hypothetical protein
MATNATLWRVQVLTPDYSVSGDYDSKSNGMTSFFQRDATNAYRNAPAELKLTNAIIQPTGSLQQPAGLGSTCIFSTQSSFVAVIPRSEDAIAYALQNGKMKYSIPAQALVGPYAIQGLFASNDAALDTLAGNRMMVALDARIDCLSAGSSFQGVKVECMVIYTLLLQGLWPNG